MTEISEQQRPSDLILKLVEDGHTRVDISRFVVLGMVEARNLDVLDKNGNVDLGKVATHGAIVALHLTSLYTAGAREKRGPTIELMNTWADEYIASDLDQEQAERLIEQGIRLNPAATGEKPVGEEAK